MAEVQIGQKVLCANCTEDIFSVFSSLIKCSECSDPSSPVYFCPDCFALGCVLGDHKPDHAYVVLDNGGFKVVNGEWTAREHINLLDSVERYGIGNWEDISRQINKLDNYGLTHTPEDTKEEFCKNFINGKIGNHSWREDQRGRARDHTQGNPLLPPSQPPDAPSNLTLNEAIVLGYMPKRDDFEVEYDNDAETLVSPLPSGPNPDEEDIDVALKMAQVDMYKLKLRERERRKRVSNEHQLITQFFKEHSLSSNQRTVIPRKKKDKNDITERLKILAEFQGVAEHQAFMASVVKERDLKSRTKDLQRARKNGITTLKDSQEYETGRLRRIKRKKELGLSRRLANAAANSEAASAGSPASIKSEENPTSGLGGTYGSPLSSMSPASIKTEEKPYVISELPGHDVLSTNERKLCMNLKLTPAHYISYKTCLLTHHLQKKKGQTPKPLNPAGLDKGNRKVIFQFLMRAGWITAY